MADAILKLEGLNNYLLDQFGEEIIARYPLARASIEEELEKAGQGGRTPEFPLGVPMPDREQMTLANVLLNLVAQYPAKDNRELLLIGAALKLLRKGAKNEGCCDVPSALLAVLRNAAKHNGKSQRMPDGLYTSAILAQVQEAIGPDEVEGA